MNVRQVTSSERRGGVFATSMLGFLVGVPTGVLLAVMTVAFVLSFKPPTVHRERDTSALDPPANWNPNKALWGSSVGVPLTPLQPSSSPMVTHLGVEPEDVPQPGSAEPEYDYFVQSSGFADSDGARMLASRLSAAGVQARVVERKDGGQLQSFVRMGPLAGRDYALALKDDLVKQGCACRVVRVER